jgi:hypothetical protein
MSSTSPVLYWHIHLNPNANMISNSNKADIALCEKIGIKRKPKPAKKITFGQVAQMVRATVRMRKQAEEWAERRKLGEKIQAKVQEMKEFTRKSGGVVEKPRFVLKSF